MSAQYVGPTISAVCAKLPRRLILTGIYRDIVTRHFSTASTIEEPDLRNLIWQAGQDTAIVIEVHSRWRPELTEGRPGVIIKPNAFKQDRRGIGNRRQLPAEDVEGNAAYETFWVGSHTLFCIGGGGAQAEILGSEVQRELTEFGPELARSLGLLRLEVLEVGAPSELEESQENWTVPVTIGCAYAERWTIRPQVPRLNAISLSNILNT